MSEASDLPTTVGPAFTRLARTDRLPKLDDLPIPDDVAITPKWGEKLRTFAAHVGPSNALRVCEILGGEQVFFRSKRTRRLLSVEVGTKVADALAAVFGVERVDVPIAGLQIRQAKRASVIAAVRAGIITGAWGAKIAGTSRTYMAELVNGSREGFGVTPLAAWPVSYRARMLANSALIAARYLRDHGVENSQISACMAEIGATDPDAQKLIQDHSAAGDAE